MERGVHAWLDEVRSTGRWDVPPYWRAPDFLENSPWSVAQLNAALAAAQRVFDERTTRRAFAAPQPGLVRLLTNWAHPIFNPVVRLGLDAIDAEPWNHPTLLRRLRSDPEFDGAEFELQLLAACKRAGFPVQFEPYRVAGGPTPDLSVNLGGTEIFVEAKLIRDSSIAREDSGWFLRLSALRVGPDGQLLPSSIRYTTEFSEKHRTDEGRRWIADRFKRIMDEETATLLRLASQNRPADAIVSVDGVPVLHVAIGASGKGFQCSSFGSSWHHESHEALRITRNTIADAASQIPPGSKGIVVADIHDRVDPSMVAEEVKVWMTDPEGASHLNLAAVIVVGRQWIDDWAHRCAVMVYRTGDDAIPSILHDFRARLEIGLNAFSRTAGAWMARRRSMLLNQ